MAKHKFTQLKQLKLLMHEYIAKFGDMVDHAYSISPPIVLVKFWPPISLREYKTLMSKIIKVLSGQKPKRHIWACHPQRPKTENQSIGLWS